MIMDYYNIHGNACFCSPIHEVLNTLLNDCNGLVFRMCNLICIFIYYIDSEVNNHDLDLGACEEIFHTNLEELESETIQKKLLEIQPLLENSLSSNTFISPLHEKLDQMIITRPLNEVYTHYPSCFNTSFNIKQNVAEFVTEV